MFQTPWRHNTIRKLLHLWWECCFHSGLGVSPSPAQVHVCIPSALAAALSTVCPARIFTSYPFSTICPYRIANMERLKLVLQYFQSNSESISNGICIILALVSVKLYTSFDFNCPCLPQYNKLYSLGVMIVPPIILFFLGVLINRHTGVMMDEWMRPLGSRSKNPAVVKWVKNICFVAWIKRIEYWKMWGKNMIYEFYLYF